MANDNQNDTTRDKELGALWKKTSGSGNQFMTGSVTCSKCEHKDDVVVFPNRYKTEERHPDYRILESKPRDTQQSSRPAANEAPSQRQRTNDAPAQRRSEGHQPTSGRDDTDIPF